MKLFIATRWGNPHEEDGPNGKDTNFLVRAPSVPVAARLAEEVLHYLPTAIDGNRPVANFIHCVKQVGEDSSSSTPSVIHGPWIEFAIIQNDYDWWQRDEPDGKWYNFSEERTTENGA